MVATQMAEHSMLESRPADSYENYRTLSKLAVLSLFFGIVSIGTFLFSIFLIFSIVGLPMGLVAWRATRRSPDELSGKIPAIMGVFVCLLTLVGGLTMYSVIYATEVPEGFARISFERLKSSPYGPEIPPEYALGLDGASIFVKGYVYPGPQKQNLKRFVLVPDLGTCCFGGQPKLTHMIEVVLEDPLKVNYSTRKRKLAGKIRVERMPKPISGLGGVYYQLTANYVK